jgi:cytosine/adenosine deaminase-related metal-dependent hydrolase
MSAKRGVAKQKIVGNAHAGPGVLLCGGRVLLPGEPPRFERADVRITGPRITEVGGSLGRRRGERVIDAKGLLLVPGLVSAHTWICHTLFRAGSGGLDALTWLRERMLPREAEMHAADVRAAARLAFAELLLGGTTAVVDVGSVRYAEVLFAEALRAGIRYTGGKTLLDQAQGLPAPLREETESGVRQSEELCAEWHGQADGRLRYAFTLLSPLFVSDEAVRRCAVAARVRSALLQIQVAESAEETTLTRDRTGQSGVEWLRDLGALGDRALFAHGVWLSAVERRILAESKTGLVHCPSHELALGSGIARLPEYLADGISVGLGLGSAAAAGRLDGFAELRLAGLIHRARSGPSALPAARVLRMATTGSARVAGLADVGRVEAGARADLLLVDLAAPHAGPEGDDLVSRLVFSARASDVHTVLVDGRVRVAAGRLTDGDTTAVVAAAEKAAAAVLARSG